MTKADALSIALTGIEKMIEEQLDITHKRFDPETLECVERNLNLLHTARRIVKKILAQQITEEIEEKKTGETPQAEVRN
jgi:hypothetical protein